MRVFLPHFLSEVEPTHPEASGAVIALVFPWKCTCNPEVISKFVERFTKTGIIFLF